MKTILINNFITNDSNKELPLQVIPIEEYDKMLRSLGFTSWEEDSREDPVKNWGGDFIYYYNNPDGMVLTISGSLWTGDYKLVKLTIPQ